MSIVIIGDLNIDFDNEIHKHKDKLTLHLCMSKYHFEQHVSISMRTSNLLINHIWSNI